MGNDRTVGRGEGALIKGGLIGALVSVLATLLLCAVLAFFISSERIPETAMGYGTLAVLLVSAAAGAVTAIKMAGSKPMIVSVLSAAVYFLLLLLLTAVCFGGKYEGIGVTAAVVAAGAIGMAILMSGVGHQSQKGKKKRKYR